MSARTARRSAQRNAPYRFLGAAVADADEEAVDLG
jgi:hypothetical protein